MLDLPVAFLIGFLSVIWFIVVLLLIFIILIQKGKGGGLGGAFGGAGGGGGLLGTKTGDFLTWFTIGLVFLFFVLAIILVKWGKGTEGIEGLRNDTTTQQPATGQPGTADIPGDTEEGTAAENPAETDGNTE